MLRTSICLLLSSLWALAQGNSTLQGTITDSTGATVPAAVVSVINQETSAARKTVANDLGTFTFPAMAPGSYMLEVETKGFRKTAQKVIMQVDTPLRVDVKLEIGQITETVNVTADAPPINTQNASLGNAFTENQIRQIPLQTRNVVELLSVQPGVTATGEVMGARRDQNNVTLDGVDINDNQRAGITAAGNGTGSNGNSPGDAGLTAALALPLDSLQEFRVTVAGQGADQGRSSGGQVSLVTKSGTNQLHGSLYEFNRNTALSANNWFSNRAGIKREPLVRNQFGASIGGPVIKNRVFFFANWESRIDASGRAVSRTVPSELMKAGTLQARLSDGTVGTLSPAELRQLDPLGQGASSQSLELLRRYPAGNDPAAGLDRGLNFTGLRFNAPFRQDDKTYVAKLDFNIDKNGNHTAFLRGTLMDNAQDVTVAQFPGQQAAAKELNNSRGLAARYNAVIRPTLFNVFTYGFTRLGIATSGVPGDQFTLDSLSDLQNFGARSFGRIIPTHNIANDATWLKGKHEVKFGTNLRYIRNDRTSFLNSYRSYSFSRNTLRGLGQDMENVINPYLQQRSGNGTLRMTEAANVVRALGSVYGVINNYSATYNFLRDGSAVPFGQPVPRAFKTNEYEFYVQDSYRVTSELTLNYGLRYSNTTPPWEANGVQVRSTVGLDQFFAERVGASLAGISGARMPNAALTYALAGPANGQPSYFNRDNNNWAPRFGFAFAPQKDNWITKVMGKGSVFRGGFSTVYDRYGNDLVVEFDRTGSPGLATQVTQPRNTNFSDAPRLSQGLPAVPAAPQARFPFTPPTILGGFNSQVGVSPDLVAPYSFLINASYARPIKGGMTVELGYAGRLSRKLMLQQDLFQPLTRFKDPQSGQTWTEAAGQIRQAFDAGRTANQVQPIAFFENMFPRLANFYTPGSATQNFFHLTYNEYAGSYLDSLNDVDRERLLDNGTNCISRLGCNTFFALQNAGLRSWVNAGQGSYHGATLVLRRPLSKGLTFDFNYTLAHSIDTASAAEAGAGNGGAVLQDSFNVRAFRGSSDFDIRHNITANTVYELPFGRGKRFADKGGIVNQLIGGWQLSSLVRYRSALPSTINFGDVWPTNYINSALGILRSGQSNPNTGSGFNSVGNPTVFPGIRSNAAIGSFAAQFPGEAGTRALVRLANFANVDITAAKRIFLPWEGHTLQFRAEGFNAFNHTNFFNASLRADRPSTFGEFQNATPARVIQLALRYEF